MTTTATPISWGGGGATELDVAAFLGVPGHEPEARPAARALPGAALHGWFQQHSSWLPKQLVTLIDHENKAVAISDFEVIFVQRRLRRGGARPGHRHGS